MPTFAAELDAARDAARSAGEVIRRHYERGPIEAELKADDSPVTRADLDADAAILGLLGRRFPGDAILSEERTDDAARLTRERVWIVDPLDGTRDFVARTGDFAVHVGLAVGGRPALGVVYQPIGDRLYWATAGGGAWVREDGSERRLAVSTCDALDRARAGVTRLAADDNLARFLADSGLAPRTRPIGASIKMLAVARGETEISVCLHGREKEWDTLAPSIVVTEAGGRVTDVDGADFVYNHADVAHRRGILMTNGRVHDAVLALASSYFAE